MLVDVVKAIDSEAGRGAAVDAILPVITTTELTISVETISLTVCINTQAGMVFSSFLVRVLNMVEVTMPTMVSGWMFVVLNIETESEAGLTKGAEVVVSTTDSLLGLTSGAKLVEALAARTSDATVVVKALVGLTSGASVVVVEALVGLTSGTTALIPDSLVALSSGTIVLVEALTAFTS